MRKLHDSKPNSQRREPNYNVRRSIAAGSLVLTGLGIHAAADHLSQYEAVQDEISTYSQPHLSEHLDRLNRINIEVHYVQPDESTPIEVAKRAGARQVFDVAQEISGQLGGDRNMHTGDAVVLPLDQLAGNHQKLAKK